MVDIPDSLRTLYTGTLFERDGKYLLEIPVEEISCGNVKSGETCRVGLLGPVDETTDRASLRPENNSQDGRGIQEPPVEEGDELEVTIEAMGDQGDGIAKTPEGFVVIVSGATPGQQPSIKIDKVQENVAFASIIKD